MNHRLIHNIIGKILLLVAALMVLPLIVAIIYNEGIRNIASFLIPMCALVVIGLLLNILKAKDGKIIAREGFIIVGLSWILMSLFGCLPFLISKEIPNFFTAFFEITSGFTTTGATALEPAEIDSLSHSMIFWRSFSHWIGGMGILVFILAFIPESKDGTTVHILRAESTGPTVGKLVSKMRATTRILYLIYMALTLLLAIILICIPDPETSLFDCILYAFATAGTGGFATTGAGMGIYAPCTQYVLAIFMVVFGINFSLYYLLLIGNFKEILKNEELRWFFTTLIVSTLVIFGCIIPKFATIEEAFRASFFQVTSIMSTTGYTTVDYWGEATRWPALALSIIVLLSIFGSCAGSTAGGLKMSRFAILSKSFINDISSAISPRKVHKMRLDSKPVDESVVNSVKSFFLIYMGFMIFCALLISIYNPNMESDILTNITASISCISNIGPGLGHVGPAGSFKNYSGFSKMVLSFEMISGRLELFPILILFNPRTWKKRI